MIFIWVNFLNSWHSQANQISLSLSLSVKDHNTRQSGLMVYQESRLSY